MAAYTVAHVTGDDCYASLIAQLFMHLQRSAVVLQRLRVVAGMVIHNSHIADDRGLSRTLPSSSCTSKDLR